MLLAASQLQVPDYIVLVGYFVLILGVGAYFYRYMKGMKDYFSGGNNIPWWLSGVSFYMSSFSVAAFVGYSALAYKYGWVAVTLFLGGRARDIDKCVALCKEVASCADRQSGRIPGEPVQPGRPAIVCLGGIAGKDH